MILFGRCRVSYLTAASRHPGGAEADKLTEEVSRMKKIVDLAPNIMDMIISFEDFQVREVVSRKN